MARRPRSSRLENRTSRLKLPVREKAHDFTPIAPGISLGYRRCKGAGRFVVRVADGKGGNWIKNVSIADDYEAADGERILDWWQAIEAARRVARGSADAGKPATVKDVIDAYQNDLRARRGSTVNATRIYKHLPATLGSKPVGLTTARDFAAWRDGLLAVGIKPITVVRICRCLAAALTLAARRDHRIGNRAAWTDGLSGVSGEFTSRNVQVLDGAQVRAVIAAAYAIDHAFGRYLEVAAVTGARNSQVIRLTVGDLQVNDGAPRLSMPSSRKGRRRKPGSHPAPIPQSLAVKLIAAAGDRAADAPLLLRADGRSWGPQDHLPLYRAAATRAGITGTMTALRHSSIVRQLLAGVPIRVVAVSHDTSVSMIEATYSKYIAGHSDALVRAAMLEPDAPPAGGNVRPLRGR